jgi:gluconate kinase
MTREQLSALGEKAFAEKVPTILWSDRETRFEDGSEDIDIIRSRAAEPATIEATSLVLASPIKDEDYDTLRVHQKALHCVLLKLPFEKLQPYRQALAKLAALGISGFTHRSSHYAQTSHVIHNAVLLERFAADPKAVWVTKDILDMVTDRTLTERVHAAEEMRPYMPQLFY